MREKSEEWGKTKRKRKRRKREEENGKGPEEKDESGSHWDSGEAVTELCFLQMNVGLDSLWRGHRFLEHWGQQP